MINDIFEKGVPVRIPDVLNDKDQRVALQQRILDEHPHDTVISVKLNIPGPIKNNSYIDQLFNLGLEQLKVTLANHHIPINQVTSWKKITGDELFYWTPSSGTFVKKITIAFENQSKLGRLFDVDVLVGPRMHAISRRDLNVSGRRCFICNRPAKECARSRRHSVKQLQNYINRIYRSTVALDHL